jgi:ribulose-phosphate 3-epimerase
MKWSASMICVDLVHLPDQLKLLEEYQIGFLHIDVMDGIFVPRFGMYPELLNQMKELSDIPAEVHLMVQNPEPYIETFVQAGADVITIHVESCQANLLRVLELIVKSGAKAGLALNPATEFMDWAYVGELVDYLLIMGINPGILRQQLKPFIIDKIEKYKTILTNHGLQTEIIVDGGVNRSNFQTLFSAGASILVGGSQTIFNPEKSLIENLQQITPYENRL